jgi:hypothetical protein
MDDLRMWRRIASATAWLDLLIEVEKGTHRPHLDADTAEARDALSPSQFAALREIAVDIAMARHRPGQLDPEPLGELLSALTADAFSVHLVGAPLTRTCPARYVGWVLRVGAVARDIDASHLRLVDERAPLAMAPAPIEKAEVVELASAAPKAEETQKGGEVIDLGIAGRRPQERT